MNFGIFFLESIIIDIEIIYKESRLNKMYHDKF
jgi:hypothetical protein